MVSAFHSGSSRTVSCLTAAVTCISLVANDTMHHLMGAYPLANCLFKLFVHLGAGLLDC